MSRIGKLPVAVPKGVKAEIAGQLIKIEGPKGKMQRNIRPEIKAQMVDGEIVLSTVASGKGTTGRAISAYHGLERALINNMVHGVSEGFVMELELIGVGYRAEISGTTLNLALGYSHPIDFPLPQGVKGSVVKEGREIFIKLEGCDRQLVGETAARIRQLRKPEVYKGKGVRYRGEFIKLKPGKAGKK